MTDRVITTVEAKGQVTAKFDLAEFCVAIHEHASTPQAARDVLVAGGARVLACVEELKRRGMVVAPGSLRVPRSTLAIRHVYGDKEKKFSGYDAEYELRWKTPTLEMVTDIYNQLLRIDAKNLDVSTPQFSLSDPEAYKNAALEAAWEKVKARYTFERKMLDKFLLLDGAVEGVLAWQAGYEGYIRESSLTGPQGPQGALGPNGPTGPRGDGSEETKTAEVLEIHPGHAVITVALRVTYGYRG